MYENVSSYIIRSHKKYDFSLDKIISTLKIYFKAEIYHREKKRLRDRMSPRRSCLRDVPILRREII